MGVQTMTIIAAEERDKLRETARNTRVLNSFWERRVNELLDALEAAEQDRNLLALALKKAEARAEQAESELDGSRLTADSHLERVKEEISLREMVEAERDVLAETIAFCTVAACDVCIMPDCRWKVRGLDMPDTKNTKDDVLAWAAQEVEKRERGEALK